MDSGGANTWVTEPKDEEKYWCTIKFRFYPSKVRKVIQEIMDEKLKNETYDANNTPNLAEELVRKIRSKIRESMTIWNNSHKNAKIQNSCTGGNWRNQRIRMQNYF